MKKVILISGSPKKEGNTVQVLKIAEEVLKENGVETEIISLHGKKIQGCIACGKCKEINSCILKDDLNEIIEKIRNSEGLIVGAPVYFGTARGDIMNLIQRVSMVSYAGDKFLSRMVGGPVAVGRRGGHTATIQEMLMFYFINDMIVVGSGYWNMVFGKLPGEVNEDEEGIATIKRFAENTAFVINKI